MGKIWISVILVFFTIFSSATIGYANSDVTPLKLKGTSINLKEARIGDTIVITFEVEDDLESGIGENEHLIVVNHSSGKEIASNLRYIGANKFQFRLTLDASTLKGVWYVNYIYLYDAAGNKSSYHYDDPLLKGLRYNVLNGVEDRFPPKLTNLTIVTKELHPGGQAKMTFSITESSKLGDSNIIFVHKKTGDYLWGRIVYNEKTKKYESLIDIPKIMKNGEWSVYYISLADEYDNEQVYQESDYSFLQGKAFIITGGTDDITPPTFKSVQLSTTSVYGGEKFTVWVDAEDKSGIKEGDISFKSQTRSFWAPLEWDAEKKLFRADIDLLFSQASGEYLIDHIYLGDNAGNPAFIYNPMDGSFPVLTILPVLTGEDSMAITKGTSFDPMEGVKAYSPLDGDMTKFIKVSGTVDPDTKGIYLLKYEVTSPNTGYSYKGYRWIAVNDEENLNPIEDTIYFNADVQLGVAQNEKLTLSSGSKITTIKESTRLTNDGFYQVSTGSNANTASAFSRASINKTSKLGNRISFVIDKKAPSAPTINVVTDKSTVLKGKTEANARVDLYINGKYQKSRNADESGFYQISIAKQKINTEIKVKATDRASNIGPFRTIKVVHAPTINTVSNKSVNISGYTLPFYTIKVSINGKYYTSGKADNKGKYTIKISRQDAGKMISVTSIGTDKKVSPAVTTKVVDKIPPAAPTVNKVSAATSIVSGKGEPRAIVYVLKGKKQIGKGTVSSKGKFSVHIVKQKKGTILSVYLVDKAGNMGKSKSVKIY